MQFEATNTIDAGRNGQPAFEAALPYVEPRTAFLRDKVAFDTH